MTTAIPIGFAQVSHSFIGGAVPQGALVTYGITGPAGDPQAAVTDIHTSFADLVVPWLNNSVTLDATILKLGPTETGAIYEWTQQAEGGLSGEPEPPQVCFLIKKRTASGGRKNRGRLYLPGCETQNVDLNGSVTPAQQGNLNGAFMDHLDFLATNDSPMVILHGDETAPTDVTSLLCDGVVATQRRRLR